MKKICRIIVSLWILSLCVSVCGSAAVSAAVSAEIIPKPFRGVWVPSVYNLDYPTKPTESAQDLMEEAERILDGCLETGMTAVFLQVRPCSDALYPSEIYPWSRYLTGESGKAPEEGFDPLAYWVSEAHERGLELHAWINPYRVTREKERDWETLSPDSPAKLHPEWVVCYTDGNYYFDPALPEVRQMIVDGALEIVRNYDVDGIHLDDYFYPGADFNDAASYAQYGGEFADIGDFRRNNVDQLIAQLDEALHQERADLAFGVSPSGIWANQKNMPEGSDTNGGESYFKAYADTRKWVKEGMVDYICPQIYWQIGYSIADYEILVNWWTNVAEGTDCKLYIGMADYRGDAEDPASDWYGVAALRAQLELNQTIDTICGEVHFSYSDIAASPALIELYREYYLGIVPESPVRPAAFLDKTHYPAYMVGSAGAFMPEKGLTRAEAAAIFARLTVSANGNLLFRADHPYQTEFTDVGMGEWYDNAVGFVQRCGMIAGLPDGTFQPFRMISRAEFVSILVRYEDADGESGISPYADVPETHWAAADIAYAKDAGWITAEADGNFEPDRPITRAEAVTFLNAATGRSLPEEADLSVYEAMFSDVTPSHWAYRDIIASAVAPGEIGAEEGTNTEDVNSTDTALQGENR